MYRKYAVYKGAESVDMCYFTLADRDLIDNGWIGDDDLTFSRAIGQPWVSGDLAAGDVVVFGVRLLTNTCDRNRLTVDIRFQPQNAPIDECWVARYRMDERLEEGTCRLIAEVRKE